MSRTAKIAAAATTLLALLALGTPAVAAETSAVGGAIGCCRMR